MGLNHSHSIVKQFDLNEREKMLVLYAAKVSSTRALLPDAAVPTLGEYAAELSQKCEKRGGSEGVPCGTLAAVAHDGTKVLAFSR